MSAEAVAAFWAERREEDAALPPQTPAAWAFGATPAHADELLALVLADHALRHRAQNADVRVITPDSAKL